MTAPAAPDRRCWEDHKSPSRPNKHSPRLLAPFPPSLSSLLQPDELSVELDVTQSDARHKQGRADTRGVTQGPGWRWFSTTNAKNAGDVLEDGIAGNFAARDLHHLQECAEGERLPKSCIREPKVMQKCMQSSARVIPVLQS